MKKGIFFSFLFSFLGHIAVFSLVSFTFGRINSQANYPPLFFLGQILPEADLGISQDIQNKKLVFKKGRKPTLQVKPFPCNNNEPPEKLSFGIKKNFCFSNFVIGTTRGLFNKGTALQTGCNFKPLVSMGFAREKPLILAVSGFEFSMPKRKESAIIFHPPLSYQLQVYFKDRQTVHIELMFNIIPGKERNSILVKRKISSGNLEVDLLSSRYISYYLFIQQARFQLNNWRAVKIDFSMQR